jgi:RNA polymerase sigma-70 factor (ECF subfamily)
LPESTRETFWVLGAQVGDRDAMDALFRAVQKPLLCYLRRMLPQQATAEDALQEVFLIVCRKIKTLRDPELFRPWVFRIASRQAIRMLRRDRKWRNEARSLNFMEIAKDEPDRDIAEVNIDDLKKSLEELSPTIRAVFVLHYFESMSLSEVGTILSLPVGTVKSRLSYGLNLLRTRWNKNGVPVHKNGNT